ncbi:MAG: HEPN domain-containing protein [Halobacteriota archaeon]|nr:HEPN domain-containing protein [Halobacteriota archaeon]
MKEEVKNWWKCAKEDLDVAEYCLEGDKIDAAAFYSQQSAEKALKTLQIQKLNRFDKTHDLLVLAKSINAPEEILTECGKITPFFIITRYQDGEIFYKKEDV